MQNRPLPTVVGLFAAIGLSLVPTCLKAGSPAIPWSQIGAKAAADYQGDGLAVSPSVHGARVRCVLQRLEGEATREGLWLTSTPSNAAKDRFRVVAVAVGRQAGRAKRGASGRQGVEARQTLNAPCSEAASLPDTGTVTIDGQTVRFTRPSLVEEYTVGMDGVRQDLLVPERPVGTGELAVRLAVSGAQVEPAAFGARLVLNNSGRRIAYSRLRVTDATGRELTACLEVLTSKSASSHQKSDMVVAVDDAEAVYPVHIDPTFSDANWISLGGVAGAGGWVSAVAVDSAGNVYIGGTFDSAGETIAKNIAKWDGTSWKALGSGISGGVGGYEPSVFALAVSGSDVYAGGSFTTAGGSSATNIAKWDGSSWLALGSGISGDITDYEPPPAVYALAVSGSDVYAGGSFTTAGGTLASGIAKWDGSNWSALGSGGPGGVRALAASGSDLYAYGNHSIAKWDGSSWSNLPGMIDDPIDYNVVNVDAMAASASNLYVAGDFQSPGYGIAKWDGSSWSQLGGGAWPVWALAASGTNLYAGGGFAITTAGGSTASCIAKWDGSSWEALGSGMNGPVNALAVSGSHVYAGGNFTAAGGSATSYIAKWDGNNWFALGSGISGSTNDYNNPGVNALAVSGSDVYAGGNFTTTGSSAPNNIAKWDGSSWTALGSGMNGQVFALAVSGSNVYAGGEFTTAGGSPATNIAKWNGSNWTALGSGISGSISTFYTVPGVEALAVSGSDLYAGGVFTNAGGSAASCIAKWNGSSWKALGSGMDGDVVALAVSGSDLYAGGYFTTAGGSAASYIAKWDGSAWSALGSSIDGNVNALVVSGTDLYAGGSFYTAGGSIVQHIAKWDGSSWEALGSGINGQVRSLVVWGSNVYAGGYFTAAGGSPANSIAQWDGSSWLALGSGMDNGVLALAVSGSDLYAGGTFTTAGEKASAFAAKAVLNLTVLRLQTAVPGPGTNTLTFEGVPSYQYLAQFATNLSGSPWFTLATNTAGTNGVWTVQDPSATNAQRFYRGTQLVQP